MKNFTDLEVSKLALDLVADVYALTKNFPREEMFGLTSQLRRASTSILANIAEGFGRYTYADKANKYTIARGEATEVEAHLYVAVRIGIANQNEAEPLLERTRRVGKMLSGLIDASRRYAQSKIPSTPVFEYSSTP